MSNDDTLYPSLERLGREAAEVAAEQGDLAPPAAGLRDRLMARIADYETIRPIADVRRHEEIWEPTGVPGVLVRNLFRDRTSRRSTVMIRMEPGARFPAHLHGEDEQCLVLSGDIRWGDIVYRAGDFVAMGKGTSHPEIYSQAGNTLLIIAGRNEFI